MTNLLLDADIIGGNIECPNHGLITPEECGRLKNVKCSECFIFKAMEEEDDFDFKVPKEIRKGSVN